jgi:hypothetical protein
MMPLSEGQKRLTAMAGLHNQQSQRVREMLQFVDDENLLMWTTSIMRGETLLNHPNTELLIRTLAATQMLLELHRRFEVDVLELEEFGRTG